MNKDLEKSIEAALEQPNPANYKTLPALAAYIDRIGAEQMHPRKFMIKEFHGQYYKEVCIIRITEKLDIVCSDPRFAPTKEEMVTIKALLEAFKDKFPVSVPVLPEKAIKEIGQRAKPGSDLHLIYDVSRKHILMVEERTDDKVFRPWTYWSDGVWRVMEPDGALPFYKPEKKGTGVGKNRIMVHEGAKSAKAAQKIVDQKEKGHPWYEELCLYEHWGILGGALAPHRSRYSEIQEYAPQEVVYLADNDYPGKAAIQEFSKHYRRKMKAVMLDNSFPKGWDIADPVPNSKEKIGSLSSYMIPATWATDVEPPSGKGKSAPIIKLTKEFSEEWMHSVTPDVYVNLEHPSRILRPQEFDDVVRPFSDTPLTSKIAVNSGAIKASDLRYNPGLPGGMIKSSSGQGVAINTHVHPELYVEAVKKIGKTKSPDPKPWLDFMEHLIPEYLDRYQVYRWVATLIARPGIKMNYSILLTGRQGVGKTTLAEKVLVPIIGVTNCSMPTESEIVDSNYNYWQPLKRLAVVNEIYSGHSYKAYNKLKSATVGDTVDIQQKYMSVSTIENWIHIIASSNSERPLKLEDDDRRWLIPTVTEYLREPEYWTSFNKWLKSGGGYEAVIRWAFDFLADDTDRVVGSGEHAPDTVRKQQVKEAGWSPGQVHISDFIDRVEAELNEPDRGLLNGYKGEPFFIDVAMVANLLDVIHNGRDERCEKKQTVARMVKQKGWHINPINLPYRLLRQGWPIAGHAKAHILCRSPEDALGEEALEKIEEAGRKPLDIPMLCDLFGLKKPM